MLVRCVSVLSVAGLLVAMTAPAQGAFVAGGPNGGVWDNFNDGAVDTVSWTSNTMGGPIQVSEADGELRIVQSTGFNGAYSTLAPLNTSLVEPATAGNGNSKVRAVMRRADSDGIVSHGLSITTNEFLRTCGDVGDYTCVTHSGSGVSAESRQGHEAGPNLLQSDSDGGVFGAPDLSGNTSYEFRINWINKTRTRWSVTGGGKSASGIHDWSDNADCGDGSCWPDGLGVAFYAHNVGTLYVDEIEVFPEPATMGMLAAGSLLLLRRRRA